MAKEKTTVFVLHLSEDESSIKLLAFIMTNLPGDAFREVDAALVGLLLRCDSAAGVFSLPHRKPVPVGGCHVDKMTVASGRGSGVFPAGVGQNARCAHRDRNGADGLSGAAGNAPAGFEWRRLRRRMQGLLLRL